MARVWVGLCVDESMGVSSGAGMAGQCESCFSPRPRRVCSKWLAPRQGHHVDSHGHATRCIVAPAIARRLAAALAKPCALAASQHGGGLWSAGASVFLTDFIVRDCSADVSKRTAHILACAKPVARAV